MHFLFGVALGVALQCQLGAYVISTFETDGEGWQVVDLPTGGPYTIANIQNTYSPTYSASGGNPGGFIASSDPSSQSFFFDAPSKFLGNQIDAYGLTLSYDIRVDNLNTLGTEPTVVLVGTGLSLVYDGPDPTSTWSTITVPLSASASGWTKGTLGGAAPTATEFQTVLSSLTGLWLKGEYNDIGPTETTSLDDVLLVPEPSSALLVLLGVGAAVCRRRR